MGVHDFNNHGHFCGLNLWFCVTQSSRPLSTTHFTFLVSSLHADRHLPKWYSDYGIITLLDTTVKKVDFKSKTLNVNGVPLEQRKPKDYSVKYKKLLLCTGARAVKLSDFKMPGSNLAGIYYLRDHSDGQALLRAIECARGGEAIVVGGGYIGMEVTSALVQQGQCLLLTACPCFDF